MPIHVFTGKQQDGGGGGDGPAVLGHLTGYDSEGAGFSAEGIWGDGKIGAGFPITGFQMVSGPGNVRNFRARAAFNSLVVATTVTFNIGGVPTALSLVIPAGSTALFGPLAGPVAVVDGDLISFGAVSTGAVGGTLIVSMSADFGP